MPHKKPIFRVEEKVGFLQEKEVNEKCLSKIAIAFSVTALLLVLALCFAVFLVVSKEKNGHLPQVFIHEEEMPQSPATFACVPCAKLLQKPSDEIDTDPLLKQLTVKVTDGREDCCASTPEEIAVLFESVMRLTASPPPSLPTYNMTGYKFSEVSAHKRLYPEKLSDNFGIPSFPERMQVCELKEDDPRYGLEHHRGVNITKTGLEILHTGLYYIYTSIQFRPQSTHPCSDFKYQTFAAYVERRATQSYFSQTLLKMAHTCCDRCYNYQETGFTGGVFVLERGDLVQVKVTGYELVHFQPETSFMGLAMLGAPDSETQ